MYVLIRKEEEENDESLKEELKYSSGFIDNDSRGTGHMFRYPHAFSLPFLCPTLFYSSTALQDFLKRNNLSHVIRAHEVKETGFQVCTIVCIYLSQTYFFLASTKWTFIDGIFILSLLWFH